MARRAGLAIFVAALVPRLVYLYWIRQSPLFDEPFMDARYHVQWAMEIATQDFVGSRIYFRSPFYPYFLSSFFWIFGSTRTAFLIVHAMQLVMGAASCTLLFAICNRIHGLRVATVAGALAAFSWILIYFEGELLAPVLLVFLLLLALWLLVRAVESGSLLRFAGAGIAVGLYAITRPNILIVAPVLLAWILWQYREEVAWQRRLAPAVVVAAGIVVCIAPVTLRNHAVTGDWVLISSQAGVNFYIGNNPKSDGVHPFLQDVALDASWEGEYRGPHVFAERELGRSLRPSEVSRYWMGRGLDFIAQDPGAASKLYARKLRLLFNPSEIPNNQNIAFFRVYYRVLDAFFFVDFALILPLAIVGFATARRDRWWWLMLGIVVSYLASFLPFFVTTRFRVPVVPLLIAMAAVLVVDFADSVRRRDSRRVFGLAAAALAAAGLLQAVDEDFTMGLPGEPSDGHYALGISYTHRGQLRESLPHLELASRVGEPMGSLARVQMGLNHADLGEMDEAFTYCTQAITRAPYLRRRVYDHFSAMERTPEIDRFLSEVVLRRRP